MQPRRRAGPNKERHERRTGDLFWMPARTCSHFSTEAVVLSSQAHLTSIITCVRMVLLSDVIRSTGFGPDAQTSEPHHDEPACECLMTAHQEVGTPIRCQTALSPRSAAGPLSLGLASSPLRALGRHYLPTVVPELMSGGRSLGRSARTDLGPVVAGSHGANSRTSSGDTCSRQPF